VPHGDVNILVTFTYWYKK